MTETNTIAAESRGNNSNFDSVEGSHSNAKSSSGAATVATVVDGQTSSIVAPKKYSVPETVMSRKSQKRMMSTTPAQPHPTAEYNFKSLNNYYNQKCFFYDSVYIYNFMENPIFFFN